LIRNKSLEGFTAMCFDDIQIRRKKFVDNS
jgi:hypothetical protein